MKLECKTKKDLMRSILIKEINKTYKYPEAVRDINHDLIMGFIGISSVGFHRKGVCGSKRYG